MKNLKFYLLIFTASSSVLLLSFMFSPKNEVGGKKLFDDFISQFDKAELPYEIEVPTLALEETLDGEKLDGEEIEIETTSSDKLISHNFSAFVPGLSRSMYSRMPPNRYYFKDVIYENEEFVLVTYGVQSYRSRVPNSVDEYILASYSKEAKVKDVDRLISLRTLANDNYYEMKKSIIDKDLTIKTMVWTNTENDKGEFERSNEAITDRYKIAADGKIKVIMTKKAPQKKSTVIRAN